MSIDVAELSVDWANKRFSVDSKDLCGSLVEVYADGIVNIVHQSAKRLVYLFLVLDCIWLDGSESKHVLIALRTDLHQVSS